MVTSEIVKPTRKEVLGALPNLLASTKVVCLHVTTLNLRGREAQRTKAHQISRTYQ
jgi:hypothetical protein